MGIAQYWNDTEKAFRGGVAELERSWKGGLEELRLQVTNPEEGQKQLAAIVKGMERARDFFSKMPWPDANRPGMETPSQSTTRIN